MNWYTNPAEYTAAEVEGREVRIWNGSPVRDALLGNAEALRNAMLGATRMPFAFTANQGVIVADRIA